MDIEPWQLLCYGFNCSNTNRCWILLMSNIVNFILQDTRHCGFVVTSQGQIPEHLPSCIHDCIIVLGIPPHGASWRVQSPHILSLLSWPPRCVCFLVSRKKSFLVVSLRVPCVRRCWHERAAFIVIHIWESFSQDELGHRSKFRVVTSIHTQKTYELMCLYEKNTHT